MISPPSALPRLPGFVAAAPHLSLATCPLSPSPPAMGMEFGWWDKDDEGVKWQISARFHGGTVDPAAGHCLAP